MVDFKKALAEQRLKKKLEAAIPKPRKATMVPDWTPRRKKKEDEPPPPDLRDLDVEEHDRKKLVNLIMQHREASILERDGKATKKLVTPSIKLICKRLGLDRFMVDGGLASYYTISRPTISKELLLAEGVPPDVITRCTVVTSSEAFKYTPPGVQEEED